MSLIIRKGADWLQAPALQAVLRDFALDDVQIELVGYRRSFAGKTWPYAGLIRMVNEGVHPLRWLVTLLHELAHVLDWRERRRELEAELGRPLHRGDGRTIWRRDRTHGKLWSQQFQRLTTAAVARGLFPGNEAAVMAHAVSGAISSDHVLLDLRADHRIQAEELGLLEEQAREALVNAQQASVEFKEIFRPGVEVYFDAGPTHGIVTGKLVRINRQTCTIRSGSSNWHVPHSYLHLGSAPPDARPAQRRLEPRDRFQLGQRVAFRHNGISHQGQVTRINQKTCTVVSDQGETWRVAFSLLKVKAANESEP